MSLIFPAVFPATQALNITGIGKIRQTSRHLIVLKTYRCTQMAKDIIRMYLKNFSVFLSLKIYSKAKGLQPSYTQKLTALGEKTC